MKHNAHYSTKFTDDELQIVCYKVANSLKIRGIIYCHVDDFENRRQWRQGILKFVQDNGIGRAMLVSRNMAYLFNTKEGKKEFCSFISSRFPYAPVYRQILDINRESFLDRYLTIWRD